MKPKVSLTKIKSYFEHIYPQLFSRVRRLSRRFADWQEALAEMIASSWVNLLQKAQRCGRWLTPGALAWIAFRRHRSGRVLGRHGNSTKDALGEACYRAGRVHVLRLSAPRGEYAESDVMAIAAALSTRERESPCVRAATRIDWAAFSLRLERRERRLLKMLVLGFNKSQCARKLGLSSGRISQILRMIAQELRSFFGPEFVPATAVA
ncbi:MAG TPA: hypothetical protein VGP72_03785 [Planctomycetota bacterium]|jgi:hypothetical protein